MSCGTAAEALNKKGEKLRVKTVKTICQPGATTSYHSNNSPVILQVNKSIYVLLCVFRKHPKYSSINYVGSGHVSSCFPEHQEPNFTPYSVAWVCTRMAPTGLGWFNNDELLLEEQNRLPAIWTVKHSHPPGNKGHCCTFGHYWIIWDDLWWGWEENRRLWEHCKWPDLRPIFISICLIDKWIKSPPSFWATRLFQICGTSQEPVKQYINKGK